jgi:hypothetical protein
MRRVTTMLAALHLINLAAGLAFWRFAPGPSFAAWGVSISVVFATAWALAALPCRRVLTFSTAAGVVAVGAALPWVWIIGIGAALVSVALAMSAGVFGIVVVACWPLLAWGAFVAVHYGSRWVLQRLGAG